MNACGGSCVDTQTDPLNCGGCGIACDGGKFCNTGACSATCGALTTCGASCVDTQTDPGNCGGCGNACPSGQVCGLGGPDVCGSLSGACINDTTTTCLNNQMCCSGLCGALGKCIPPGGPK